MKKVQLLAATAFLSSAMLSGAASAATFVFKGDGNNVTPIGAEGVDFTRDCGTTGSDYCTIDHEAGFNYDVDGVGVNAIAYADGVATRLIQDIIPGDSGLGAFSELDASDDQTQADSNEAMEFNFDREVTLSNVEFNAGGDVNCSSFGPEGPCGDFRLTIDGTVIGVLSAQDVIANLGTGMSFLLEAVTPEGGFSIAQFTVPVSDVPVPAALPLLLSGVAGLGFASRRRRAPLITR